MIPESGSIRKSSIEIMSKMLQTFTVSYPERNKRGPAFYVLFTNFSKFEDKDSEDYFSYGEEDGKDKLTKFTYEDLIEKFQTDLAAKLQAD